MQTGHVDVAVEQRSLHLRRAFASLSVTDVVRSYQQLRACDGIDALTYAYISTSLSLYIVLSSQSTSPSCLPLLPPTAASINTAADALLLVELMTAMYSV